MCIGIIILLIKLPSKNLYMKKHMSTPPYFSAMTDDSLPKWSSPKGKNLLLEEQSFPVRVNPS